MLESIKTYIMYNLIQRKMKSLASMPDFRIDDIDDPGIRKINKYVPDENLNYNEKSNEDYNEILYPRNKKNILDQIQENLFTNIKIKPKEEPKKPKLSVVSEEEYVELINNTINKYLMSAFGFVDQKKLTEIMINQTVIDNIIDITKMIKNYEENKIKDEVKCIEVEVA